MILITGGAGFIGSHLAERLCAENKVRVLDNLSAGAQNVELLKAKGIEVIEGDIRDKETVANSLKGCSIVYHLAAMNRAARSIKNPVEANEINITGTLNVLEACRKENAAFVFASSSSVYGGKGGSENDALKPLHPYGVGKLAAEHYARVYHELYGLKTVILRYTSVFGPRQRGDIDHAAVIPKFIDQILEGKQVTVYGEGTQTRQFTYVKDTVEASAIAAEKSLEGDAFNVATPEETSVARIVELIEKQTGRKAVIDRKPMPKADPSRNFIDVKKIEKSLGFKAKYSFGEGLKETIKERLNK
ncbi:NAD-dependent epimerase/dehydratase family protein [Candidatus Micrarchaeota archaeon]|nr:NAD-dependent epimerase/dehydratase family protein [Candidatus Micrarchaeota archaeon]